eukprot:1095537-Pelagomonas_calceolata.AAC.1
MVQDVLVQVPVACKGVKLDGSSINMILICPVQVCKGVELDGCSVQGATAPLPRGIEKQARRFKKSAAHKSGQIVN